MDKPTPPKTITTRMLGTGPEVEFVLLTDAIAHGEAMAAWGAAQYKEDLEHLLTLLKRYRNEVPLGHQPHMLAHIVDAAIDKARKA